MCIAWMELHAGNLIFCMNFDEPLPRGAGTWMPALGARADPQLRVALEAAQRAKPFR